MPLRLNTHLNPLHLYLMNRLGQGQNRRNALKEAKRLEARFIGINNCSFSIRGFLNLLLYGWLPLTEVSWSIMKSIQLYAKCNQFQKAISLCITAQSFRCREYYNQNFSELSKNYFTLIQLMYYQYLEKMSHEQGIKYCSILIDIYEKSSTYETSNLKTLYLKILKLLKAINAVQFNSDTHEKIMATYEKLLSQFPNQSPNYWEKVVDYLINNQSNKSEILKFCSTHRNGAGFENGLLYLFLEEQEKAWASAELLKKSKQIDQYKNLSIILAYYDLNHSRQLRSFSIAIDRSIGRLEEIANLLQRKQKQQSQEQRIRRHEERIRFYRQNNHLFSLEIANQSLLKLIHLSGNAKDSHKRGVQIYQDLMELNRKQFVKLEATYLKLLRLQDAQPSPNYQFLLEIREKYFQPSFETALLLMCLKEYGKVCGLIDFWRIEGVMSEERKDLGEALRLIQSKDAQGLKKYFALPNTGSLDCIETLKASLIRKLEIELEKSSSEAEVLIDIEKCLE